MNHLSYTDCEYDILKRAHFDSPCRLVFRDQHWVCDFCGQTANWRECSECP